MVKQEDIAKKLNISRASVSRALNGGKLNEETRKKILETAKEMGYVQNNAATSLASKKNIVIQSFLITSVVTGYYEAMKNGLEYIQELRKGYNFEIKTNYIDINMSKDLEKMQIEQFFNVIKNKKTDGVLLSPLSYKNLEIIKDECRRLKIPLITLDMPFYNPDICHIGPNYEEIGKITAALISNLIRKKGNILVITFDEGYELNNSRIKGFKEKINKYNSINITEENLESISFEKYKEVIECHLNEKYYDAIYATFRAEYVGQILKEMRFNKDIVVVGNDINQEIESLLLEDWIRFVVYQRPYYQGYIAADSYFKFFYQHSKFSDNNINTGSDLVFKENISIIKNSV